MRIAGRSRDATALYLDSVRTWASLGDDRVLPRPIAAERKLEFARGIPVLPTPKGIRLVGVTVSNFEKQPGRVGDALPLFADAVGA